MLFLTIIIVFNCKHHSDIWLDVGNLCLPIHCPHSVNAWKFCAHVGFFFCEMLLFTQIIVIKVTVLIVVSFALSKTNIMIIIISIALHCTTMHCCPASFLYLRPLDRARRPPTSPPLHQCASDQIQIQIQIQTQIQIQIQTQIHMNKNTPPYKSSPPSMPQSFWPPWSTSILNCIIILMFVDHDPRTSVTLVGCPNFNCNTSIDSVSSSSISINTLMWNSLRNTVLSKADLCKKIFQSFLQLE